MIGALIGGAIAGLGSIFGGIKASEAMKKQKRNLESRKAENANWYARRYNEDATQRADAQRVLTKTAEIIRERNRGAAGRQAVMGGTEESVAATKQRNNEALADAVGRIAAQGAQRKDAVEDKYVSRAGALDDKLNQMEVNKAAQIAKAVGGVAQAGVGIADAFGPREKEAVAAGGTEASAAGDDEPEYDDIYYY